MKSELEKMIGGEGYQASDPMLVDHRKRAHQICHLYNSTPGCTDEKLKLLIDGLGSVGEDIYIEPPFYCDYLFNISVGNRVYFNFGCVLLDCAQIFLGDDVKLGPNVQVFTAAHPIDPDRRRRGEEFALPIKIGSGVWIGGGSIILPGVTIGSDVVIGAGSVVTQDLPPRVVAVGNPCRTIREIDQGEWA